MPIRVQRKRTKGWKMPENTVSVTRPGKWGNPFRVDGDAELSTDAYRAWINGVIDPAIRNRHYDGKNAPLIEDIKRELKGKNLACFCSLDQKCHADILLEIANS